MRTRCCSPTFPPRRPCSSAPIASRTRFDSRNSSIGTTRTQPDNVTLEVSAHYALSRLVLPPPPPATSTLPSPPITLPDVRSLFLGFHYTFAKLPDEPMRRASGRRARRLLHDRGARLHVRRSARAHRSGMRIAGASRRRMPPRRCPSRSSRSCSGSTATSPFATASRSGEGILEWNKAFERIGYKDAIRVEIQPDDADFDTSDIRHASVRWQTVAKTSYGAIGPSVVDPRTGEILDADIGIDANNVRVVRNLRHEYLPPRTDAFAALAQAQFACERQGRLAKLHVRRRRDRGSRIRAVAARSARRARSRQSGRRQVRRHLPEERDDARGRAHARAPPQFPRIDRLLRRRARRRAIHRAERHLRLGHGIQPVEPRDQGRTAGRIPDVDTRSLRLLGDRIRLPGNARRSGSGGAREDRGRGRASRGSRIRPTRTSPISPSTPP